MVPHPPADSRTNDAIMIELIKTIQDDVKEIQSTLSTHLNTEPQQWATLLESMMIKAFPEGDADGHRLYHLAVIKAAEDKAQFWEDMRKSTAKWGLAGFGVWAFWTLAHAVALWIQTGAHPK